MKKKYDSLDKTFFICMFILFLCLIACIFVGYELNKAIPFNTIFKYIMRSDLNA